MNFKGKCAVKLMHGLPKLEQSRNVSSKVIKSQFMVQPQLEKRRVHRLGQYFDGPGPWTRSTEGVHGLGIHVLCFPQFMTRPAHQNPVSDLHFN